MVGCFHLDVHILQVQNNITAHIFSQVDGAYVKIAGILMGVRSREPLFILVWNKKNSHLWSYMELISHVRRLFQNFL